MKIVVIGSGVAGVSFAEKYRTLSPGDDITLLTWERDGYYSRPLLSRGFTQPQIEQSIVLKPFEQLRENRIDVCCGVEVTAINRVDKTVVCEGQTLAYDKLVLAQGSAAFIPPPFRPYRELFFCLNSLADLKALRRFRQTLLQQNRRPDWAIVGGGLIGCEVASDLAVAGDNVALFHATDRLMERQLAPDDSVLLQRVLQDSGVDVLLNQNVQGFLKQGEKVCVQTDVTTEFDGLIVACGFKPRIELASAVGLDTGRGIKVNGQLRTSDESIYAIGDAAELPNGKLYAFILPIRNQAIWLAEFLAGQKQDSWTPPVFTTKAKVHGFNAVHPYNV